MPYVTLNTNYAYPGDTINFHAWDLTATHQYLCGIWISASDLGCLNSYYTDANREIYGSHTICQRAPLGSQSFVVYDPSTSQTVASASISILNRPPVAEAGPNKTAQVGQEIVFDASASYDPDGTITWFHWSFGDGSDFGTVLSSCSHSYSSAGTYTVVLTVTDNGGLTASDTCTATVTEAPPVISNIDVTVVGLRGPPYPLLAGATVTITGPETRIGTTDANGHILFSEVALGTYTCRASKSGYHDDSKTVDAGGAGTHSVTLQPRAWGNLRVKVQDTYQSLPIVGATVRITEQVYPYTQISQETDTTGYAFFDDIDGEVAWELYVYSLGYDHTQTVTLAPGETRAILVSLEQPITGQLTLTVRDQSTNNPIANASATVNGNMAYTNQIGAVSWSLPPGTYNWTVAKGPYYYSKSGTSTIQQDITTTEDVYLTPTGITPPEEITPTLQLTSDLNTVGVGQPVTLTATLTFTYGGNTFSASGISISAKWSRATPADSGTIDLGTTDANGTVSKPWTPGGGGDYTLYAQYAGCNNYTINTTAVHLLEAASSSIIVTVTVTPGKGVLEVRAYADSTEVTASVEVVGVGTYSTPFTIEVDPGTYTLNAVYGTQTDSKTYNVPEGATITVDFHFTAIIPPALEKAWPWLLLAALGGGAAYAAYRLKGKK